MPQLDGAAAEILRKLQEVAPAVWTAFLRQQHISGVCFAAWAGLAVILAIGLLWCGLKQLRADEVDAAGPLLTVGSIFLFVAAVFGWSAVRFLLNPEYYAICDLLQKIPR